MGWPIDKLNALRLGQRLVTEVPARGPGRRAFVGITPRTDAADSAARVEGWRRSDSARTFRLAHWDYDEDYLGGWDYDIGAEQVRTATAVGEAELLATLAEWKLEPGQFRYPWHTDDPIG